MTSVYSTGYVGVESPGAPIPIERQAFWSAEFENILAVSVISRQDMIYVGEQVPGMATEIIGLIDASLTRA